MLLLSLVQSRGTDYSWVGEESPAAFALRRDGKAAESGQVAERKERGREGGQSRPAWWLARFSFIRFQSLAWGLQLWFPSLELAGRRRTLLATLPSLPSLGLNRDHKEGSTSNPLSGPIARLRLWRHCCCVSCACSLLSCGGGERALHTVLELNLAANRLWCLVLGSTWGGGWVGERVHEPIHAIWCLFGAGSGE